MTQSRHLVVMPPAQSLELKTQVYWMISRARYGLGPQISTEYALGNLSSLLDMTRNHIPLHTSVYELLEAIINGTSAKRNNNVPA